MSFRQARKLDVVAVWQDASFLCCDVFAAILRNVHVCAPFCVRDVNFYLIVIRAEGRRVLVGPFWIVSES